MASSKTKKVEVENVNHPGQVKLVDGPMYAAMEARIPQNTPEDAAGSDRGNDL